MQTFNISARRVAPLSPMLLPVRFSFLMAASPAGAPPSSCNSHSPAHIKQKHSIQPQHLLKDIDCL